MIKLSVVVPCYNEEETLPETITRLCGLLSNMERAGKIDPDSAIYLVDDGSRDLTWRIIADSAVRERQVRGVKLSRNRGHQNALLAGLEAADGDAVVTIDADLQDDITVIERMVDLHAAGAEIVYGVRQSRATDTIFKRFTAEFYYRALARMGVQIIFNHADYRLLGRKAIIALQEYSEVNLFLRGIVPQLGFASATVHYARTERFAGESKYPLRKMVGLAVNGITSFSVVPLRMIAALGLVISVLSIIMIGWVVAGKLFVNSVVPGWASSVVPVYLLGGIEIFSLGVIGEYVGKIYLETKRRPRYFIEEEV